MALSALDLSSLESHLWESANILRGPVDAADFKTYIFPMLFFKRISDVYDEEFAEALKESGGDRDYALFPENHRFQIPEGCHWKDVREKTANVGQAIQHAFREIEKANPGTRYGIFGDARWSNKDRFSDALLRDLVEHGIHPAWPPAGLQAPRAGMIVEAIRTASEADLAGTYRFRAVQGRRAAFYTYRGRIDRIIDGDTLWVDIDCGFRVWTQQKVRLRGIDTPELPSAGGRLARDFVKTALNDAAFVVLTTTKPDKYDRYLADVFYLGGETDPEIVIENGIFLNQQLLEEGLAKRFRG